MPNDTIFDPPAPEPVIPVQPDVAAQPSGNGAPSPDAAVSQEAIQAAVSAALEPMQSSLQEMQQENQQLRAQLATPADPPPAPAGEDDFYSRFATDPEGTVDTMLSSKIKQIAPLLQQHNNVAHEGIVAGHVRDIDDKYGPGTFQEVYAPVLSKQFDAMRQSDPTRLSDPNWVAQQVNSLTGFQIDTLVARKAEYATKGEQQREEEVKQMTEHLINNTNLSGGLRSASIAETREPTEHEEEYIRSCAQAGVSRSHDDLRASVKGGNTLADFRTRRAAAKGDS